MKLARVVLEIHGFVVTGACDAEAALEQLKTSANGVVIGSAPMSDLATQLAHLIADFSSKVSALARQMATEQLSSVLNQTGSSPRKAPGGRRVQRAKGEKRPRAAIEETKARLLDFIASNPGLRVEQINRELGTTTHDVALPLKKLVAEKSIKTKGQRRATAYFPR